MREFGSCMQSFDSCRLPYKSDFSIYTILVILSVDIRGGDRQTERDSDQQMRKNNQLDETRDRSDL